jgi:hypothetical protein
VLATCFEEFPKSLIIAINDLFFSLRLIDMINDLKDIIDVVNIYFQVFVSLHFYGLLNLLKGLASQLNPPLNVAQSVIL